MSLASTYYGVHSARYRTVACSPSMIVSSLNCSIDIRDPITLARKASLQAHEDTVMALFLTPADNPDKLVSVSYGGELKAMDFTGNELFRANCCEGKVRHASLSHDGSRLATCAEGGDYNGQVELWQVSPSSFTVLKTIVGDFQYCEVTPSGNLFSLRSCFGSARLLEQACLDAELPAVRPDDQEYLQVEHKRENSYDNHHYFACLFESASSRAVLLDNTTCVIASCQNARGELALMYLNRTVLILDMDALLVLHRIQIEGSGAIRTLDFQGDLLYYSPKPGFLTEFNASSQCQRTVKTGHSKINNGVFYMRMLSSSLLLVCEESGIFLYSIPNFAEGSLFLSAAESSFQVTCCGLDIAPDISMIAAADFNGQLKVLTSEMSVLYELELVRSIAVYPYPLHLLESRLPVAVRRDYGWVHLRVLRPPRLSVPGACVQLRRLCDLHEVPDSKRPGLRGGRDDSRNPICLLG
jgi:hypothetical protein